MFKSIAAFISGLFLVSCGNVDSTNREIESQIASSDSRPNLVVKCQTELKKSNTSGTDTIELVVEGKKVSLNRTMIIKAGSAEQKKNQTLNGRVNSVFDFNRLSENSARLLLVTSALVTTAGRQTSSLPLKSALVQYSGGQLTLTNPDGHVLISHSNCKTTLAKIEEVKGMMPSNN